MEGIRENGKGAWSTFVDDMNKAVWGDGLGTEEYERNQYNTAIENEDYESAKYIKESNPDIDFASA